MKTIIDYITVDNYRRKQSIKNAVGVVDTTEI